MKRGRKTAGDLNIVRPDFERPQPPDSLTESQKEIWCNIVASEPVDFFRTAVSKNMLADYCRHCDTAIEVSKVINEFDPRWIKSQEGEKKFKSLQKMRELETNAAARLATKLRLTNQSRYTPHGAFYAERNMKVTKKPWET